QAAINRFVEETNSDPKPFVWTADAKRVLAAVKRGKEKLESIHGRIPQQRSEADDQEQAARQDPRRSRRSHLAEPQIHPEPSPHGQVVFPCKACALRCLNYHV
ncbi:MAG: hypothetical protein ACR2KT_16765, partial [Methylocella sp.]